LLDTNIFDHSLSPNIAINQINSDLSLSTCRPFIVSLHVTLFLFFSPLCSALLSHGLNFSLTIDDISGNFFRELCGFSLAFDVNSFCFFATVCLCAQSIHYPLKTIHETSSKRLFVSFARLASSSSITLARKWRESGQAKAEKQKADGRYCSTRKGKSWNGNK